jgi:hypothetical protein
MSALGAGPLGGLDLPAVRPVFFDLDPAMVAPFSSMEFQSIRVISQVRFWLL